MAIQYDLLPLPGSSNNEGNNKRLHPKVVTSSTVTLKQMAEDICQNSSFTVADVVGLMEAFADCAAQYLNNSCHVDLGNLGILSLSLACDKDPDGHQPVITETNEVKPHQLHVSKVVLNAKPEFMKKLQGPFVRATQGFPSNVQREQLDAAERRAALQDYLAQAPTITIRRYAALTGLPQKKASDELRSFADPTSPDSFLTETGIAPHIVFVKKG